MPTTPLETSGRPSNNRDLEAARLRIRALIAVLDEDLAAADQALGAPLPRVELPPDVWERAEEARRLIDQSLKDTERAAAEATQRAQDWQAKAALALQHGAIIPARLAVAEAQKAHDAAAALTADSQELRVFLTEWAVRVSQAPPARPPEPRAGDR